MSMRLTHPQRTRTERTRARRTELSTTATPVRASDVSTTAEEHRRTLADAVSAAHDARLHAEQQLRRSELERDQSARALELNVPPAIDEARREGLRTAYAEAAGRVADARRAYDRARAVEDAAAVIIANAAEDGSRSSRELASGLAQLFG